MASDYEGDDDIVTHYENQESENDGYGGAEEATSDNDNDAGTGRKIKPPTPKKHTRNSTINLNTERLKGPKGIQMIENYFEGFKFYGKGHEKTDLDRIMKRLEHWSYRLFPKYHFDDFLARVEQLGAKKDLQVYIKKYRLDMITPENHLIIQDNMDDEENQQESVPLDDFDLLITEQIQKQKQAEIRASTSAPVTTSISNEDAFDQLLTQSNNIPNSRTVNDVKSELNNEIRERIEKNKQLAIQRRLQRQREQEEEEEVKRQKMENIDIETLHKHDGNPAIHDRTNTPLVDDTQSLVDTNGALCVDRSEEVLFDEKSI